MQSGVLPGTINSYPEEMADCPKGITNAHFRNASYQKAADNCIF
jgi:hypothetical protein